MENPCKKYEVDIEEIRRLAGFSNAERLLYHQGKEINALTLFYMDTGNGESFADMCASGRTCEFEQFLDEIERKEEKGLSALIQKR